MTILLLNQFYPPDPAPTARLLDDVARELERRGHRVVPLFARQSYRAGAPASRLRRIARELRAHAEILGRGLRAPRPDLVLSLSSPPGAAIVAASLARWRGARCVHWAMDLYPEIAGALGEIRADSLVYHAFDAGMGWAYRQHDRVIALDADMAARLARHGVKPCEVAAPWILGGALPEPEGYRSAPRTLPRTWLYSGNLGRAHEWETLLAAQQWLEESGAPWQLMFQGGGTGWVQARERARKLGLRAVEFLPYAEERMLMARLLEAHVLVATQRPETCGLVWPSKLALASRLPRPLLWVGPTRGAIAQWLAGRPATGLFEPRMASEIAGWLQRLDPEMALDPWPNDSPSGACERFCDRILALVPGQEVALG